MQRRNGSRSLYFNELLPTLKELTLPATPAVFGTTVNHGNAPIDHQDLRVCAGQSFELPCSHRLIPFCSQPKRQRSQKSEHRNGHKTSFVMDPRIPSLQRENSTARIVAGDAGACAHRPAVVPGGWTSSSHHRPRKYFMLRSR